MCSRITLYSEGMSHLFTGAWRKYGITLVSLYAKHSVTEGRQLEAAGPPVHQSIPPTPH